MKRHLEPRGFRVHQLTFKDTNPMHIDGSISTLCPGLVLCNPDRPCNEIEIFEKAGWKVVFTPKPIMSDGERSSDCGICVVSELIARLLNS